jgi:hypothetical protein
MGRTFLENEQLGAISKVDVARRTSAAGGKPGRSLERIWSLTTFLNECAPVLLPTGNGKC